jgi:DNA-binding MarR family transcriptional regulator
VHRHNPSLAERAARHGRLDGSVLATLRLDIEGEAQSVSELARLCAATKAATLRAVRALELEGAVELIREPGSRRHRVRLIEAA